MLNLYYYYIKNSSYDPGHVCFFRSADIWHKVAKWVPTVHDPDEECTPGRIGSVSFFPAPSLKILQDKPAGWGRTTDYGRWAKFF